MIRNFYVKYDFESLTLFRAKLILVYIWLWVSFLGESKNLMS